jgi:DEAD/DEAH box helicase domain-containing protein
VACSATIQNPLELAQSVVGEPFELVESSGAPTGSKTFLVYNPPVVDPIRQIRKSAFKTASRLAADLITEGVVTLVFCQTRRQVEIVLRYIQDKLKNRDMDPKQVRGYRGGYLPLLRREIETALKNKALTGVVATNALELGIDVGALDAVVMAGYPGTIAALRQRAGRAGRRQDPSLAVLVTTADPLDQFLAGRPAYLFESSPELALVQPDNVEVLLSHLRCAAFELPFDQGECFGSLDEQDTRAALSCLVDEGDLVLSKDRYYYIQSTYPAADISLRQVGSDRIVVIVESEATPIAEADLRAARAELHEQAVYQHEGQTYIVNRLDLEQKKAYVEPVEPTYYTTPISHVYLDVVQERERKPLAEATLTLGDVTVTEEITGFKKVRFYTHENLGYGEVGLDPLTMETEAMWLVPPHSLIESLARYGQGSLVRGLEGFGHVLHQVASLRLMCDPRDLAHAVQAGPGPQSNSVEASPFLFMYDTHPGGVGLSDRAFEEVDGILDDTHTLIESCKCAMGCPSCVGPVEQKDLPVKAIARSMAVYLKGEG